MSACRNALVGHFVEVARDHGYSWTQIGQQPGVTRQAAQQRFVASGPGEPTMSERFDQPARRVLELAQIEAIGLDHHFLGTEHLLTRFDGRRRRRRSVSHRPRQKVLQLAAAEDVAMSDDEVSTQHLLLGLVREGGGAAAQILDDLGADEQRVCLQLSALLGRACAPPSRRSRRGSLNRSR